MSTIWAMVSSLLALLTLASPATRYVDPMIGTGGSGHTFPGAVWPHGMVQLSPDTDFNGWDHCSGYQYDDKTIAGFSHMHLSGTGGADLGDVLVAPHIGEVKLEPDDRNGHTGYRSSFDHKSEIAKAGYYSVFLKTPGIQAELTTTKRVGIHRYTFPKTDKANLTFEISNQIGGQDRTYTAAKWISPTELEGAVFSHGWANDQRTYFVARFSKPATSYGVAVDNQFPAQRMTEASGKISLMDAFATFDARDGKPVMVKVALSNVDNAGARKNLDAEAKSWNFESYVHAADRAWQKQLSSLTVASGTEVQKKQLYTALYHANIHPSLYNDVDGKYLGMDLKVHQLPKGREYYHIYSLWDTYRAAHPLYTLLEPTMNAQFINGMLDRYQVRGELPVWELCSNETYCMIGDPAVPAVANAIVNGVPGIDQKLAMQAVLDSFKKDGRGQTEFNQYGFDPCDKERNESVSKTLEFAYARGAASEMARSLGQTALANDLWKSSQAYKTIFDPKVGLMCPKTSDGNWVTDYNPKRLDYDPRYVTEGNSWQYNWHVMHDVPGLVRLYGGQDKALAKLIETFDPANQPIGSQPDITGLIGEYVHGNEPSHHVIYLFTLFGRPDLADRYIREARDGMYGDGPLGICGNDDAGQTSAWYAFSAFGFYPLDPASGEYVLGIPMLPDMTLHLENGKTVHILAKNLDLKTGTVKRVTWNGAPVQNGKIRHADLVKGGTLVFEG